MFQAGERGIKLVQIVFLARNTDVGNQVMEGCIFGNLQRPLDLIHGFLAALAFRKGDRNDRMVGGAFRIAGKRSV